MCESARRVTTKVTTAIVNGGHAGGSMNPKVRVVPIAQLVLDEKNANKGAKRGRELLEESLEKYGAARSVVVGETIVSLGDFSSQVEVHLSPIKHKQFVNHR